MAGAVYPGAWDVESAFGSIDGETRAYLTAPIPTNPTLALRAGGKKVWGTFPFHESAFLGGPGLTGGDISNGSLRGFRKNRFAGDAALYGNSELRLVLAKIKLLVPGELGLFGAADAGQSNLRRGSRRCRYMAHRSRRWIVAIFSPAPTGLERRRRTRR